MQNAQKVVKKKRWHKGKGREKKRGEAGGSIGDIKQL